MSVQIVARLVKSGSRNDLDLALARNANKCVRISADADGRGVDYRSTAKRVKIRQLFDCLFGVVQTEIRFFDDDQVAADHHVLMSIRDAEVRYVHISENGPGKCHHLPPLNCTLNRSAIWAPDGRGRPRRVTSYW